MANDLPNDVDPELRRILRRVEEYMRAVEEVCLEREGVEACVDLHAWRLLSRYLPSE